MKDRNDQSHRAKRDLERLSKQGGLFNTPTMPGKAKSLKGHFMAEDADQADPIEVWGSRIGRGLSLIAVILLLIWLVNFLGRA